MLSAYAKQIQPRILNSSEQTSVCFTCPLFFRHCFRHRVCNTMIVAKLNGLSPLDSYWKRLLYCHYMLQQAERKLSPIFPTSVEVQNAKLITENP